MSRHDNLQNGGRSYDPVQWDFQGDIDEARKFTGIGRQVLGELKHFMSLSEIQTHAVRKTLRNGVVIVAMSVMAGEGMADIDKVLIVAPTVGGGREQLIGFVVNLADMGRTYKNSSNGTVGPFIRVQTVAEWSTTATRIEMISLNSGITKHEPFGNTVALTRPGIIEGTFDDFPDLGDHSSEVDKFYYWDAAHEISVAFGPAQVIGTTVEPPDDPHVDLPFGGVGYLSPVNSRRIPIKAIGLYCKAESVSRGEIKTQDTNTDGFVAVVKKPMDVIFDDASWDATKTMFTPVFNTYQTYTVQRNGEILGLNVFNFPGSPFETNMATVATFTHHQTVAADSFTFETDTKDEDWRITGEGDVTLFLISDQKVYKVSHAFPDLQFWDNSKQEQSVIEVKLGKEFERIEETYKITEKIIY